MAKKGEFNIEIRAEELGLNLQKLSGELENALKQAISDVADATYANIVAKAQAQLNGTRADYLAGLSKQQIGEDSYLISLDTDWSNMIEKGWSGEEMKKRMLSSSRIVQQGSRAGQPWVRTAKDGHKYAAVPFEHQPSSKAIGSDLASAIKGLKANNSSGAKQSITKIFRDINGNAIDSGSGKNSTPVARVTDNSGLPPELASKIGGMVKYQRVTKNEKTGKEVVQSIYHTYRVISEAGKTWKGYKGLKAFDDAEAFVSEQIDNILKSFLK